MKELQLASWEKFWVEHEWSEFQREIVALARRKGLRVVEIHAVYGQRLEIVTVPDDSKDMVIVNGEIARTTYEVPIWVA